MANLLKDAIAEAKQVRETAYSNAKEALEEQFAPHLKAMIASKLQEMELTLVRLQQEVAQTQQLLTILKISRKNF